MATRKKAPYVSHTIPSKITATSRMAVKIRDNYYTIEATEERTIETVEGIDMDLEWTMLFDDLNDVVDMQLQDIVNTFKNPEAMAKVDTPKRPKK